MVDRILGITGIVLAVVFGILTLLSTTPEAMQQNWPGWVQWANSLGLYSLLGFLVGITLAAVARIGADNLAVRLHPKKTIPPSTPATAVGQAGTSTNITAGAGGAAYAAGSVGGTGGSVYFNAPNSQIVQPEAMPMPENWWDWPGAPKFILRPASSRPATGPWKYEISLEQIDGSDIGRLRYRYRLGEVEYDLKEARFERKNKWRLDNLTFEPKGVPFEIELRFWWQGTERFVRYFWKTENQFQNIDSTPVYTSRES